MVTIDLNKNFSERVITERCMSPVKIEYNKNNRQLHILENYNVILEIKIAKNDGIGVDYEVANKMLSNIGICLKED